MPYNAAFSRMAVGIVAMHTLRLSGGPMRFPHRATLLLPFSASVGLHAAACTSSSMSDTPHIDFVSDTYMLQPGEEKYLCYTTNLPADRDIAIVKLTPTYGAATHHILV